MDPDLLPYISLFLVAAVPAMILEKRFNHIAWPAAWVFFVLFVTWVSDTTAFFAGRRLGRRKLAPGISPGKTWEGTVGGICGGIAVSLLFFTATPFQLPLTYWQAILLSALVSVLGQTGDLVESLIKRNLGVKDSGRLMPGHGGILDRIDSLLFAGLVVYYYAVWVA